MPYQLGKSDLSLARYEIYRRKTVRVGDLSYRTDPNITEVNGSFNCLNKLPALKLSKYLFPLFTALRTRAFKNKTTMREVSKQT